MPDPARETISASQVAMLFEHSPYGSRWLLWQHFKNNVPIEPPEDGRMRWGNLMEQVILAATADHYRLEVIPNLAREYIRRGQLGATIDGHMVAPDQGEIIVEAKNVDWLRWRDTWTETAAPMHIELQLQEQLLVRDCPRGIIACFVGGNDIKFYERDANPEIHQRLREEARLFFASIEHNEEPDPLGSPRELPALAHLYPATDPEKVLEAPDDDELAETIATFGWAREQEGLHKRYKKIREGMQAKLLARAGEHGVVKAPGVTAYIEKSFVKPQRQVPPPALALCMSALFEASDHDIARCIKALRDCWPSCWPETRKASVQNRIKVVKTDDTRAAPERGIAA